MNIKIPTPYYTLIETTKGSDPVVVVVNSALRTFTARKDFAWHLKITIECQILGQNGMPTADEAEILTQFEDEITSSLAVNENSIFLARTTCRKFRDLIYRVHDPALADDVLKDMASITPSAREWEYRMEQDIDWTLANPELRLLEKDTRFN